jgi:hypothetical protein
MYAKNCIDNYFKKKALNFFPFGTINIYWFCGLKPVQKTLVLKQFINIFALLKCLCQPQVQLIPLFKVIPLFLIKCFSPFVKKKSAKWKLWFYTPSLMLNEWESSTFFNVTLLIVIFNSLESIQRQTSIKMLKTGLFKLGHFAYSNGSETGYPRSVPSAYAPRYAKPNDWSCYPNCKWQ